MEVWYGISPDVAARVNDIADHTEINTGMAVTTASTFTPMVSGDYYFGFHAYSTANQSQLFLDNIVVAPTLSVPETVNRNLSWYPNPVKGLLNLSDSTAITDVAVINMIGQKVFEARPNL